LAADPEQRAKSAANHQRQAESQQQAVERIELGDALDQQALDDNAERVNEPLTSPSSNWLSSADSLPIA